MVESEEIMRVAKLMRIRIDDEKEHVKRVQKILEYFDTLDAANVESENLESNSMSVEDLRDDVHSKLRIIALIKLKTIKALTCYGSNDVLACGSNGGISTSTSEKTHNCSGTISTPPGAFGDCVT